MSFSLIYSTYLYVMEGTKARFEKDLAGKIVSVPDENGRWTVVNVKDLPKPDLSKYGASGIDPYSSPAIKNS